MVSGFSLCLDSAVWCKFGATRYFTIFNNINTAGLLFIDCRSIIPLDNLHLSEAMNMSFVDELRKKAEAVNWENTNSGIVNEYINRSVAAIRYSCTEAAKYGRNRVDGAVFFHPYGDDSVSEGLPNHVGDGKLITGLTRKEESEIIAGIQKKISLLGFCNFKIASYRPEVVISRYKEKGWGIFQAPEHVPVYSNTDGFCIEVHLEW